MTLKGALHLWCLAALLSLELLAPRLVHAQVPVPLLVGHVIDQTATLTQAQNSALEQSLTAFEARKGTQVAVLLIATTAPENIEQFALRVAEQWRLGRKRVDDGVILLVAKDDHTVRIEVGYGLEGVLSDLTSRRIIDETILPQFKLGNFFGGVRAGTEQIIHVVEGEPLPETQGRQSETNQSRGQLVPFLVLAVLAIGSGLRSVFGRVRMPLITGGLAALLTWLLVGTLLYSILAGLVSMFLTLIGAGTALRGIGGYFGSDRGRWSDGGFRGGGGGFGGGGASGRW